jgi:predicted transglutaminase-like cysteine proteinase
MLELRAATLAVALCLALPTTFATAGSLEAHRAKSAGAPLAYLLFCLQHDKECQTGKSGRVQNSQKLRQTLERVNRSVNRSIRFKSDSTETWNSSGSRGDCEDYALTKRKLLLRAGVPAGALRLATVRTRRGEGHAVLVVMTSSGELVLDNARANIVERSQTDYRWISIASKDPRRWTNL